jgi:hypothetical protein
MASLNETFHSSIIDFTRRQQIGTPDMIDVNEYETTNWTKLFQWLTTFEVCAHRPSMWLSPLRVVLYYGYVHPPPAIHSGRNRMNLILADSSIQEESTTSSSSSTTLAETLPLNAEDYLRSTRGMMMIQYLTSIGWSDAIDIAVDLGADIHSIGEPLIKDDINHTINGDPNRLSVIIIKCSSSSMFIITLTTTTNTCP